VINSRPLTHNGTDPNDFSALTPNHFVRGMCSEAVPLGQFMPEEMDSRKRWRQTQVLSDHVWHRWLKEYVPSLNVHHKWTKEQHDQLIIMLMI